MVIVSFTQCRLVLVGIRSWVGQLLLKHWWAMLRLMGSHEESFGIWECLKNLWAKIWASRQTFGWKCWDLGKKVGIWAWKLKFWPWGWHLGLKVGIWATRLEFDPRSKDLGFKAHIVASMLKLGLMAWISPWRPGFGSKGVRGNVEGGRERYPYMKA